MGFFTHHMTKKDTGPRRFSGQPPGWCSLQHLRQKTSVFTCFYHGVGNYDGQWLSVCLDLLQEPPTIHNILVGGAITILKNMKVNGKDDISYIMENKTCLKPPTSIYSLFRVPKCRGFSIGKVASSAQGPKGSQFHGWQRAKNSSHETGGFRRAGQNQWEIFRIQYMEVR